MLGQTNNLGGLPLFKSLPLATYPHGTELLLVIAGSDQQSGCTLVASTYPEAQVVQARSLFTNNAGQQVSQGALPPMHGGRRSKAVGTPVPSCKITKEV
jgi:hypothetical protein